MLTRRRSYQQSQQQQQVAAARMQDINREFCRQDSCMCVDSPIRTSVASQTMDSSSSSSSSRGSTMVVRQPLSQSLKTNSQDTVSPPTMDRCHSYVTKLEETGGGGVTICVNTSGTDENFQLGVKLEQLRVDAQTYESLMSRISAQTAHGRRCCFELVPDHRLSPGRGCDYHQERGATTISKKRKKRRRVESVAPPPSPSPPPPPPPRQLATRASAPRIKKTAEQKRILNAAFRIKEYPSAAERVVLVRKTGLTDEQIRLYFQNLRNKLAKRQASNNNSNI